jgi:hypothetical protein
MTIHAHPSFQSTLSPGMRVAVKTRAGCWSSGFEIAEVSAHGYRLRRIADGTVLPFEFGGGELRLDPVDGGVQCPDCGLTLADWPVARYASSLTRRHRDLGFCEA